MSIDNAAGSVTHALTPEGSKPAAPAAPAAGLLCAASALDGLQRSNAAAAAAASAEGNAAPRREDSKETQQAIQRKVDSITRDTRALVACVGEERYVVCAALPRFRLLSNAA
jgi:hypothetical protein